MRPIDLTLSAFGSYKGTEHIDFTQLGDRGVFLISGKTGAGKSTIFDAISFALFGKPSGDLRKEEMFRSEFADPKTRTYVKLRFAYSGKEYTVERSLPYERKSGRRTRNADGELVESTTSEPAKALLSADGEPTLEKVQDVNARVQQILGVDRDQFVKIAMIPQGEFQKLLLADNDTKQKILRKVFGTERFQKIEEDVDAAVKAIDGRRKEKMTEIRSALAGVKGDEASQTFASFRQALEEYADPAAQLDGMTARVEALVREDREKADAAKEAIRKGKDEEARLSRCKTDVERNNEEKRKRDDAAAALELLMRRREAAQKEQEKNPERQQEAEKKAAEKAVYERQLPKYPTFEEVGKALTETRKQLTDSQEALKEALAARERLQEGKKRLETELKGLEGCDVEQSRITQAGKDLKEQIRRIRELQERIAAAEKAQKEYEIARSDLQKKLQEKQAAAAAYEAAHTLLLSAQAGYLAAGLEEGTPCPVCGSVHHPAKAVLPEGAPSQDRVNALKDAYEKAAQAAVAQTGACSGLHSKHEAARAEADRQIGQMAEELDGQGYDTLKQDGCAALAALEHKLNEKINGLREQFKAAEQRCKRQKEIAERLLPEADRGIADLSQRIENDRSGELQGRIAGDEKRLGDLRAELSFGSEKEARAAIEALGKAVDTLKDAIKAADEAVRKYDGEVREKESLLADLDGRIDPDLPTDLEQIKKDLEENRKAQEANDRKKTAAEARLLVDAPIPGRLREEKKAYGAICEELAWKKNLSDTLNGRLAGKDKIELETFVLTSYFDRILHKASVRLNEMSSGQYDLIRSVAAGNLREKTGLGIAVMDHHSGKVRDVKSLSGGESFLASLALALGLSDETQSSAGGIRIDTMFIDEGFGSLSPDVLELALRTLEKLAAKGTLIGLISHVESMKDRYRRIDVEKTAGGGSTIAVR
ncbi:MAG: SMC family ATPase [Bacteroidales bacterium]|nr:SMC family ATPase [Bacteroidales bacterium]